MKRTEILFWLFLALTMIDLFVVSSGLPAAGSARGAWLASLIAFVVGTFYFVRKV